MSTRRGKNVIIAGGGLVGPTCAKMLSLRGFNVKVIEKRSDLRKTGPETVFKSFNIGLAAKGINALKRLGIWSKVYDISTPIYKRNIHHKYLSTSTFKFSEDKDKCPYQVIRSDINKVLLTEAENPNVELIFDDEVTHVDIKNDKLTTKLGRQLSYDYLFGADGAGSVVRKYLHQEFPKEAVRDHTEWLDSIYKEIIMPPDDKGNSQLEKNAHHTWARGRNFFLGFPRKDTNKFSILSVFPNEGKGSKTELGEDRQKIADFFKKEVPELYQKIPDLVDQYIAHPPGHLGTLDAWPWNKGNVCLIGDAAHAVTPFVGQGMNVGMNDCIVIGDLYDKTKSMEEAIKQFAVLQKPNADAVGRLALDNFKVMSDPKEEKPLLMRTLIENVLTDLYPKHVAPLYKLVSASLIPYHVCLERGNTQIDIFNQIHKELGGLTPFYTKFYPSYFKKYEKLVKEKLTPMEFEFYKYD